MKNLLKQIVSFILPVTVLVIVPLWIEKDWTIHADFRLVFGLILILFGLVVMGLTISSFIRIGRNISTMVTNKKISNKRSLQVRKKSDDTWSFNSVAGRST